MASLLKMPVEVQWQIFNQLLHDHVGDANIESKPDVDTLESTLANHTALGNLSLTCKYFKTTTAPLLYQRVSVSIRKPAAFIRLIRHFSRFPEYAVLVKDLTIDSDTAGSFLSTSQRDFLVQEAYRLGLELSLGPDGLLFQFGSILIDVALCQLSTIRELKLLLPWTTRIEEEWHPIPPTAVDLLSGAAWFKYASRFPTSFVLGSLQRLEVYPRDFKISHDAKLHKESLTALLRHTPALTYLMIGLCGHRQAGYRGIIQNPLLHLKDIHLADAVDKDLTAVQSFCPRLERFRLGLKDRSFSQAQGILMTIDLFMDSSCKFEEPQFFATPALLKTLLPVKETLSDFDLGCGTFCAKTIEELDQLSQFEALRPLRLVFKDWPAGDNAALINKFPPRLESLCLGAIDIPVDDIAILLIARIRDGRLPNLKRFEYTLLVFLESHPFPAGGKGISQEAASALKECGVRCVFRPYPRPMYGSSSAWGRNDGPRRNEAGIELGREEKPGDVA